MKRKSRSEREAYRRQAEICKAFANPTRLRLIDLLGGKERWSSELQAGLGISKANLSQHLSILKSAGIVSTSRVGKRLHCGLSMPGAKQAAALLRSMTKARQRRRIG
jgi:DNA-binding transcriptional ArsR family regulator